MNSSTVLLCCLCAALWSASSSWAFFSEESLKDLSRLPHLQRHWASQQHRRMPLSSTKVTTPPPTTTTTTQESPSPSPEIATTTEAEEEEDVEDGDHQLTEMSTVRNDPVGSDQGKHHQYLLTSISLAKERLKARRLKAGRRSQKIRPPAGTSQDGEDAAEMVSAEVSEVRKHMQRMAGSACSVPSPRLIYIRPEQYGGIDGRSVPPNVRYLPECTWLHRCSDDAGCCMDESKTCSPSDIRSVSLPFFVLTMDLESKTMKRSIVRLTFENHTACECIGRNSELMPRTEPARSGPRLTDLNEKEPDGFADHTQHRRHHHHAHPLRGVAPAYRHPSTSMSPVIHLGSSSTQTTKNRCRCPSSYTPSSEPRIKRRGSGSFSCSCQCKDRHCSRLKRGLDTFSLRDRGCISEKKCQVPSCDHGHYITFIGRCPRREEKSQTWLRLLSS